MCFNDFSKTYCEIEIMDESSRNMSHQNFIMRNFFPTCLASIVNLRFEKYLLTHPSIREIKSILSKYAMNFCNLYV